MNGQVVRDPEDGDRRRQQAEVLGIRPRSLRLSTVVGEDARDRAQQEARERATTRRTAGSARRPWCTPAGRRSGTRAASRPRTRSSGLVVPVQRLRVRGAAERELEGLLDDPVQNDEMYMASWAARRQEQPQDPREQRVRTILECRLRQTPNLQRGRGRQGNADADHLRECSLKYACRPRQRPKRSESAADDFRVVGVGLDQDLDRRDVRTLRRSRDSSGVVVVVDQQSAVPRWAGPALGIIMLSVHLLSGGRARTAATVCRSCASDGHPTRPRRRRCRR